MQDWINFAIVIAVQALLFASCAAILKVRLDTAIWVLAKGVVLGLPFGAFFDFLIGRYSMVFWYSAFSPDWLFFLLNALLSYGIAIATVGLIPISVPELRVRRRGVAAVLFVISMGTLVMMPKAIMLPIVLVFVAGAAIVVGTEAAAVLLGVAGPLFSLIVLRSPRTFVIVWISAVIIGLIYELTNSLFPVWHWKQFMSAAEILQFVTIVALGYFVLVSPLFLVTKVLEGEHPKA